jgi:hypothetical protein
LATKYNKAVIHKNITELIGKSISPIDRKKNIGKTIIPIINEE